MQIFNQITFQTYVRNNYNAHLQEILLTLQNEYTDWEDSVQHPTSVRNQVNYIKLIFSYQNKSIMINTEYLFNLTCLTYSHLFYR